MSSQQQGQSKNVGQQGDQRQNQEYKEQKREQGENIPRDEQGKFVSKEKGQQQECLDCKEGKTHEHKNK